MAMTLGQNYSVEVKSRFELFMLDEEDNDNHVTQENQTLPKRVEDDNKQSAHKTEAMKRSLPQQKITGPPARGGRPAQKVGSGTTRPQQTFPSGGELELDPPKHEHQGQKHHKTHNAPVHGREFDRRSGSDRTGVKPVMKKDGFGLGNWGTIKDEMEATMNDQPIDSVLDTSAEQPGVTNEEEFVPEPEAQPTYTLEEWKAMQKEKRSDRANEKIRSANDGQDVFKNMKLIKTAKVQEEVSEPKYASVYQKQNDSDIVFFHGSNRGGPRERAGGRGGFRGGRGGPRTTGGEERPPRFRGNDSQEGAQPQQRGGGNERGRGGNRGGRGAGPRGGRGATSYSGGPKSGTPHILNENDFPSLSLA